MLTVEQRLEKLERQAKRYRMALVLLTAALCGMLSLAATDDNRVHDVLKARRLEVVNAAGDLVVVMTSDEAGGVLGINNNAGQLMAIMTSDKDGGKLVINNNAGQPMAGMGSDEAGGRLLVWNNAGQPMVGMVSGEDGGSLSVLNNAGGAVVQAHADDYGHGYIGVFDRKGKGRTLTPR